MFKSGKHHCRKCGHVVCNNCSQHRLKGHKVCKKCYNRFKEFEGILYEDRKTMTTQSAKLNAKYALAASIDNFYLNVDLMDSLQDESAEDDYTTNQSSDVEHDLESNLNNTKHYVVSPFNGNRLCEIPRKESYPDFSKLGQKTAPMLSMDSPNDYENEIKMSEYSLTAQAPMSVKTDHTVTNSLFDEKMAENDKNRFIHLSDDDLEKKGYAAMSFDLFMDSCSMNGMYLFICH